MGGRAYVLEADCGDLIAIAIAEWQVKEVQERRPELPVMTESDVDAVGRAIEVLGGHVVEVRRP